jgi:amidase
MNSRPLSSLRRLPAVALFTAALLSSVLGSAFAAELDLSTATIADLESAMKAGTLTSEKLTQLYLERIAAYDKQGPTINTVIAANPKALETARALDAERKAGKVRSPIHGIPIVLKDNYDTYDLPTTAGSQLLEGSIPPDDAYLVKKLRDAGAVILAKVNLSEFAGGGSIGLGARAADMPPAYRAFGAQSTMGGITRNPHDLTKAPAGSSGGTGAAIAGVFAQFGMGSDTGGSIRGPCAANGIAGLKPTLGLLSRDGIVPLALSFDTGGPMARNVYDVAVSLGVMTGVDPADPATKTSAGKFEKDYTKFLKVGSLKGARIGVARDFFGQNPETDRVMEEAIATLKKLGATVIDPIKLPESMLQARQTISTLIIESEFKAQIAGYLKTVKPGYPKTLAELAAKAADPATQYRNDSRRDGLARNEAQGLAMDDPVYLAAKNEGLAYTKATMLAIFSKHQLDALVYPTSPRPAQPLAAPGGGGAGTAPAPSGLANQTGFPDLIVPAGVTNEGLPVAISFFGVAYSEAKLLGYGYDFEQATHARVLPKTTPLLPGDKLPIGAVATASIAP